MADATFDAIKIGIASPEMIRSCQYCVAGHIDVIANPAGTINGGHGQFLTGAIE